MMKSRLQKRHPKGMSLVARHAIQTLIRQGRVAAVRPWLDPTETKIWPKAAVPQTQCRIPTVGQGTG
jgi:hypothetical protein